MRIVMFCHSLVSDWNHGNAHFLRGIAGELQRRGHSVVTCEPREGWSMQHLLAEHGRPAIDAFVRAYPHLRVIRYDPKAPDLESLLHGADLILVHEWNDPFLIERIGEYRATHSGCRLLFHDTHHRAVSDQAGLTACELRHYDGVLAFGQVIRDRYLSEGWTHQAWTWHEAADTRVFQPPRAPSPRMGELVWIGNWGDEERADELREFLLDPVARLGIRATVFGVRYPPEAIRALADAGIVYGGWLPNHEVPRVFGRFALTIHVPRRPYVRSLPGIPTIRPFEAMACGIPLVSAPWQDVEQLFTPGRDYLVAADSGEMARQISYLLDHPEAAAALAAHGRRTILARHTCGHRVDELLDIYEHLCHGAPAEARS